MPLPVTRPIQNNVTTMTPATLDRSGPSAPDLALPPSNGVAMPYGQGTLHTVKDPAQVVPTPSKVVPAQVS